MVGWILGIVHVIPAAARYICWDDMHVLKAGNGLRGRVPRVARDDVTQLQGRNSAGSRVPPVGPTQLRPAAAGMR